MLDQKKIRWIAIVTVVILVGTVVFYIGSHGRIVVKNKDIESLSIVSLGNTGDRSEPVNIENGAIVSSGRYVVRNQQDGLDYLAHISVPGWFQSAEITFASAASAKTTRAAAFTYEHFFPADNGALVSYSDLSSYIAGYTTHPAGDAFGGKYVDTSFEHEILSPTVSQNGQLLGIDDGSLVRYSFKTKTATPIKGVSIELPGRIELESDVTRMPKIQRSSDANSTLVGIYEKTKQTLATVDGVGKVVSHKVPIENDRGIVYDINATAWAIVETTSDIPASNDVEHEETRLEYSLKVRNLSKNVDTTLSIGKAQTVSSVAVSPSGKFVAVLKDGELWVYEVSSKQLVMVHPFTITTQVFWNKNKLYSLSSSSGLSVFDTNTKQLLPVSISSTESLSFSSVTPFGSKLYVTAYSENRDSKLPDGYIVELDKADDTVTRVLADFLPLKKDDYEANYLGNTIYIRITYYSRNSNDPAYAARVNLLKAVAQSEIKNLLGSDIFNKCRIVYEQ